jgi:hypothetical protein
MNIETAERVPSKADLARPQCPHCGSVVLMAELAAFNPHGRIRHTWSCDDCGHEFVTSMTMRGRQPWGNVEG